MNDVVTRLYFHAPVWAQNLLLGAYGRRLRRLRYGGVHGAHLDWLLETDRWSEDRLARLQLASINDQLRRAAGVPIYRDAGLPGELTGLEQLMELPTLEKDDLRRPRSDLVGPAAANAEILEIHTGGTTGKPLSIYCAPRVLQRNYAFFERFKRWAGIGPGDRVATFAGRTIVPPEQEDPPFWRHNRPSNTLLLSSYHISERTLPAYVEALRRFRPRLIDSYPSSIEPIARYVREAGVRGLEPAAVITSSETLSPETRGVIREGLGCPVFDHYGAAEMAALITQCEHGSYHPNPEFGIVELIRDGRPAEPGEVGEIVATGFINDVMPLIRYRTGDRAIQGQSGCPCGRAFPVVEGLEGREDDILMTPEGRRIGRLDPIFKSVTSFYETRVIQTTPDHVRVETVPAAHYDPADEDVLRTELSRRLGPSMTIEIVKVEAIPRTRSGKFRAVENRVARGTGHSSASH